MDCVRKDTFDNADLFNSVLGTISFFKCAKLAQWILTVQINLFFKKNQSYLYKSLCRSTQRCKILVSKVSIFNLPCHLLVLRSGRGGRGAGA